LLPSLTTASCRWVPGPVGDHRVRVRIDYSCQYTIQGFSWTINSGFYSFIDQNCEEL